MRRQLSPKSLLLIAVGLLSCISYFVHVKQTENEGIQCATPSNQPPTKKPSETDGTTFADYSNEYRESVQLAGNRGRLDVKRIPYNYDFGEETAVELVNANGNNGDVSTKLQTPTTKQFQTDVTIVTGFLDIGRGEWRLYQRPMSEYLRYLTTILALEVPMVIFVDSNAYPLVQRRRSGRLASITNVTLLTLNELPLFRYLSHMEQIIENERSHWRPEWDAAMQRHPEGAHAKYNLVTNSKTYMLTRAAEENPFRSRRFVWLDGGYLHGDVGRLPSNLAWRPDPQRTPDGKVSLISLYYPSQLADMTLDKLYRQDVSAVSGGFLVCDASTALRLHALYEQTVFDLLRGGRIDDDQTVLVMLIRSHPNLFNVVHGDWFDGFVKFGA